MRKWTFAKGHGTKNDFVILCDRHGMVKLDDADVRYLCDRRGGIGGDGLLRATLASSIPEWEGDPDLWFMDYRNADGSIAEMCGNGLRVFVRYLMEEDLASGEEITVATRAGVRRAWPQRDGRIRTDLGTVTLAEEPVQVTSADGSWQATEVEVGNPHAVCFLTAEQELDQLDLTREPSWSPAERYPNGTNVEFVRVLAERHIAMRVHERGAGETMSCGTGTVAAAAAHARRAGLGDGEIRVDVPGGWLTVELAGDQAMLTGPAVVVARGHAWLPDSL
ncbi:MULTISPECIES: diaminopimelate epimerase [unclassified Luteococcus]|uniref:diaminopimelate epimerase n=1 Tax=unclassified Luteococcus TaxID=2639923 RepID=UPI00313E9F6B